MTEGYAGGGTQGISMITGIASMPFQSEMQKHKKEQSRLQRKHQALLNANAREQMKQNFVDLNQSNKDANLGIEQDAADRGLGDSSINTDNQARREREFVSKKAALERSRMALESGILTTDKINDIQNKIAKAQNAINMINAISGGASGVVDYYGVQGGPTQVDRTTVGGSIG